MNRLEILFLLTTSLLVEFSFAQPYVTKIFDEVEHEHLHIEFSKDSFEQYLVTVRSANVSDGEIYWINENIDTIHIRCIDETDEEITLAIKESHSDWMDMLYDEHIVPMLEEKYEFPTIIYRKNKNTKVGMLPDSCALREEVVFHLSQRIKLLKEINDHRYIRTWEKLIGKIENCKSSRYNFLQQSRYILELDNYIIPVGSDTLKYRFRQQEHFGFETNIMAYNTVSKNGTKVINLEEYNQNKNNKSDFKKHIELFGSSLTQKEKEAYANVIGSMQSYSRTTIELDANNTLTRYLSKINSSRLNVDNGLEHRFHNYEIKRLANSR